MPKIPQFDSFRARMYLRDYVRLLRRSASEARLEISKERYLKQADEVGTYEKEQERLFEEYWDNVRKETEEMFKKLGLSE